METGNDIVFPMRCCGMSAVQSGCEKKGTNVHSAESTYRKYVFIRRSTLTDKTRCLKCQL